MRLQILRSCMVIQHLFKPVSKSLLNFSEMGELNLENEHLTEEKNRTTTAVKSQNCEKVDPLVTKKHNEDSLGNIPRLLNFGDRDDLINGRGNKMEDCMTPCTVPSTEVELSEKGECYMDKSVMNCKVPEQIQCLKVDACHVVKDISVDEGLSSPDRALIEHGEVKSLVGHYHDMNVSGQCNSENLSHRNEVNSLSNDDATCNEMNSAELIRNENVSIQCCSKNQLQKGEGNIDAKIPHNILEEGVVPENMLLFHNSDKENCHPDSYHFKSDKARQHSEQEQHCSVESLLQKNEGKIEANDAITKGVSDDVLPLNALLLQKPDLENSRLVSSNFNGNEEEQQSEQETSEELITAYSTVCSVAEEPRNSNCFFKPPLDSKVERGSIIFNFDCPTTSSREENPHNAYRQRLQTLPGGFEDGTVDSLTTSSRSFLIQDGHGESSFSAMGPMSGPISYSGPISHSGPVPFSGSISLRSDSSTTSTRSFAFPALHTEWNSSPVKMTDSDRRHFRKHRVGSNYGTF
ncbi:hypothetical protein NE237_007170 [Protea cynaroides]|uniref:Uncharacterized protein n=1 Tax=Protea cynaroides TaxID=273540 RepID=A0A9Q0KPI0_9MAGN|nr:hypothetical protein NE237_007170 [Protea cynaroides]